MGNCSEWYIFFVYFFLGEGCVSRNMRARARDKKKASAAMRRVESVGSTYMPTLSHNWGEIWEGRRFGNRQILVKDQMNMMMKERVPIPVRMRVNERMRFFAKDSDLRFLFPRVSQNFRTNRRRMASHKNQASMVRRQAKMRSVAAAAAVNWRERSVWL